MNLIYIYINYIYVYIQYIYVLVICLFGVNYICFCMLLYLLLQSTQFERQFARLFEVSEGIVSISVCTSYFVHLYISFSLTFHLHREIWLLHLSYSQDKSSASCNYCNHSLTPNNALWDYVTRFVLSVSLSFRLHISKVCVSQQWCYFTSAIVISVTHLETKVETLNLVESFTLNTQRNLKLLLLAGASKTGGEEGGWQN